MTNMSKECVSSKPLRFRLVKTRAGFPRVMYTGIGPRAALRLVHPARDEHDLLARLQARRRYNVNTTSSSMRHPGGARASALMRDT